MTPAIASGFNVYIHGRTPWLNGLALTYVGVGYGFSLVCLSADAWPLNLLGVLLLMHTLIWAAYLIHECIHGTIFRRPRWNAALGQLLLWLTGSCYNRYPALAQNHLAHHRDRADFASLDLIAFLQALPKPASNLIVALEWLYFPAIDFIMRWFGILSPFLGQKRRDERARTALLLLLRGSLFATLAWYSPRAVILYFLAYIGFINILRFLDCFQHTYQVFRVDQTLPRYDLAYEEAHTFSNILSRRWRWLNLLFLNFGYHNAHHRVMRCPWYRLPQLDAELYRSDYRQYLPLARLVGTYHRFRVHRLFNDQGTVVDTETGLNIDQFVGGIGVSFLLAREPFDWLEQSANRFETTA